MEIKVSNKHLQILGFFFTYPNREIHIRELSRELKISHTWVKKISEELSEFITSNKGPVTVLKANTLSEPYKNYKKLYNQFKTITSGIADYLIEAYERPKTIVLFGSYFYGEDTENSDIDIAIITDKSISLNLNKYESFLRRKISIHEIKTPDKHFLGTLANGIVLYGYLSIK